MATIQLVVTYTNLDDDRAKQICRLLRTTAVALESEADEARCLEPALMMFADNEWYSIGRKESPSIPDGM